MGQNKHHRQTNQIRTARVGTFLEKDKRQGAPDTLAERSEQICDMCGAKTSMLRVHAGGLVCWTCKASTVKE